MIAKTDAAHRDLSRQFRAHSVHRVYLALVAGAVRRGGLIERALGRDPRDRRRVSTRSPATRRAVTEYRVAERLGPEATLVEARPRTGRMHQIRVHLASIGHPVLGDASYGAAPADPALRPPDAPRGRARLRAPGERGVHGVSRAAAGRHGARGGPPSCKRSPLAGRMRGRDGSPPEEAGWRGRAGGCGV